MVFRSDGTPRPAGLYEYLSGNWAPLGASGGVGGGTTAPTISIQTLASDVSTDGVIGGLTLSSLTIGKWYRVVFKLLTDNTDDDRSHVDILHDGNLLDRVDFGYTTTSGSKANYKVPRYPDIVFQATNTSVTFVANSMTGDTVILGNGTMEESWVRLEEYQTFELASGGGTGGTGSDLTDNLDAKEMGGDPNDINAHYEAFNVGAVGVYTNLSIGIGPTGRTIATPD